MLSKNQLFLMKYILTILLFLGSWYFANGQTNHTLNADEHYKLGMKALNNYQYQKALDHFFECNRSDYDNQDYLQKLALCYMRLGDYTEAKFSYNALLKKDSSNVNAWSNLGSIYEKELNYSKASNCYQELLMIDSTNSYYFRQNAFMALRMKSPLLALAHFDRAHELNEKDLVVINEYSSLLLGIKQPKAAEKIIDKGLKFSPNNLKLLYTKADILYQKKDYENIITTIQQVMSMRDTAQYYQKMIGASYLHLEQYDSSIYHLEEVVKRGQESDLTYYQLALAYRGKENIPESEKHYELAIKKGISENVGMYYKNLALLLDEQKKYKAGIAAWKKAIEYSPKKEVYLFYLAQDCDNYYKDKKIARRYYRKYYATKHTQYREYVRERIQYLNGIIHQQGG